MKRIAIVAIVALALAPLAVFAGTLTVGEKVKLGTGFGAPYSDDLATVTYTYYFDAAYLRLDAASLAGAADIYETVEGSTVTGVFTGTARDGIVAGPVFEAIAPTPVVDDTPQPTNISIGSVTAVNSKGKAISVAFGEPEPLTIVPEPEQPAVVWLFRWDPVAR